jgi:hypothetical protein
VIPTSLNVSFFYETSTVDLIKTLLYLINLPAWELTSRLNLPYQPRGMSSVELDERLGLRQHLLQGFDHSFPVPSLPAVASFLGCGHAIDPTARTVVDSSSVTASSSGVSTTSLDHFYIRCSSLYLSGRAAAKHVHAASGDSPVLGPCSIFTNIETHDERNLVTRREMATWIFHTFTQTCESWRIG